MSLDDSTGAEEAIEFEYSLNDFCSHLGNLRKINDAGIRLLYIVYWENDDDKAELRKRIKGRRGRNDFTGKVEFVCLKESFSAGVECGPTCLRASWVFPVQHVAKKYPFSEIDADTAALERKGVLERIMPDEQLYRTSGFNKVGSEYIECDHWKQIHFYTTSSFASDKIPCKLLMKPTGCDYFSGYFNIKYAFFINKGNRLLPDYFRRYYFYPYREHYDGSTCFVYSDFTDLSDDRGRKLYRFLENRIRLDVRGSRLIDPADIERIDRIIKPMNG